MGKVRDRFERDQPRATSRLHHYVPQSLLRQWADTRGKALRIDVDATKRSYSVVAEVRPVRHAMAAEHWNTQFADGVESRRVEEAMQVIETTAGHHLKDARRAGPLVLDLRGQARLAAFFALQRFRTPKWRGVILEAVRSDRRDGDLSYRTTSAIDLLRPVRGEAWAQAAMESARLHEAIGSRDLAVEAPLDLVAAHAGEFLVGSWGTTQFERDLIIGDEPLLDIQAHEDGEALRLIALPIAPRTALFFAPGRFDLDWTGGRRDEADHLNRVMLMQARQTAVARTASRTSVETAFTRLWDPALLTARQVDAGG